MKALLYIGLAQTIFATFTIFTYKNKSIADRILGFWMLTFALELSISLIKLMVDLPFAERIGNFSFSLTYGPFLFLYVTYLTRGYKEFRPYSFLHFIPFLFVASFVVLVIGEPLFSLKSLNNPDDPKYLVGRMIGFGYVISFITYGIATFRMISSHKKKVGDFFSYSSDKVTLNWTLFISITFFAGYSLSIIFGILNMISPGSVLHPRIFSILVIIMMAYAFSYYGFRQPVLYKGNNTPPPADEEEAKTEVATHNDKVKYERSGLKDKDAEQLIQRLKSVMEDEKPFLDGELTINDLADQLQVQRYHLTQVINERLGKNFYGFINEYRIQEVKRQILNPENDKLTILAIAFNCGFNSKSSFNGIFKQYVGLTPSQFKSQMKRS